MDPLRIIVIGGGAAGFFGAITFAENHPSAKVILLEKSTRVLQKVKVSGGGRCNVTHACFDPKELVKYYPRGGRELLGAFHRFGPAETIDWFGKRGVKLKTESDGRMFPVTDDSQTIVDCLLNGTRQAGVEVLTGMNVTAIKPPGPEHREWIVETPERPFHADYLLIATGSSTRFWDLLESLGHRIIPPVPSLFTFQIRDPRIKDLAGISVPFATVTVNGTRLQTSGPLLITHWGMSGPAILKLSSWGARELHELSYRVEISVNWLGDSGPEQVAEIWHRTRTDQGRKGVSAHCPFPQIPRRLWERLLAAASIPADTRWADLKKEQLKNVTDQLTAGTFSVHGKSTFKEEFVTAGGVDLIEVNMKNFSSKLHPGLFLAGEVLNIDALTGGFNFQAAWTGSWLAGMSLEEQTQK